MSQHLEDMVIVYPPLNEAQAAVLATHLANNAQFVETLLRNEAFVRELARMFGIPESRIIFPEPDHFKHPKRRTVQLLGWDDLLQAHWGIDIRIARALQMTDMSIDQIVTASKARLTRVRNLGDKSIRSLMEMRGPIPYRGLRFNLASEYDKALYIASRLAEALFLRYIELPGNVLAIPTETFDKVVALFNANDVHCLEVVVKGDPPEVVEI